MAVDSAKFIFKSPYKISHARLVNYQHQNQNSPNMRGNCGKSKLFFKLCLHNRFLDIALSEFLLLLSPIFCSTFCLITTIRQHQLCACQVLCTRVNSYSCCLVGPRVVTEFSTAYSGNWGIRRSFRNVANHTINLHGTSTQRTFKL
jgi:hypothetical protein